jgi:starch phosphorylase
MVNWEQTLKQQWARLQFGEVKVDTRDEQHLFEIQVYLNDLDPKAVRVELYADGVNGNSPVRQEMSGTRQLAGSVGEYVYRAAVSSGRPPMDYTARIIPHCAGVAVPLELPHILWQR